MDWNNHLTLLERAACGMLCDCETLEPAEIKMLAHPHNAQAADRLRDLLLKAIEEGQLLAIGLVCDAKARNETRQKPVHFAVLTIAEWVSRHDKCKQSADIVLQRMRALVAAGRPPTLTLQDDHWPHSVTSFIWFEGPDPQRVLDSVCACDPHRIEPERVLLFDGMLSRCDITRDSLRNFIATIPQPVRNQIFPIDAPLWRWLGTDSQPETNTAPAFSASELGRRGGEALAAKTAELKRFAIKVATDEWSDDSGREPRKISAMAEMIRKRVENEFRNIELPALSTFREWIKEYAPPEAKKPGRPKSDS
ncbi:MAG: hypothetical protein EKK65_03500 [Lysobacterales bacterium]|nr:MAG: hypothetical protein EKK65_03500 [Xanthomonadales bacterium]